MFGKYTYCLLFLAFISVNLIGQNNVGIGTQKPDLSAITHIDDSVKGLLIPRTDTMSIHNYVNSLSPNPGIAHGLTIFETNMREYYIYNGLLNKWQPITNVRGPRGPRGVTGPTGPRGERGNSTKWRDMGRGKPLKITGPIPNKVPPYFYETGDTCGDYYHETATGLLWTYDCDSSKWVGPIARWRNLGAPIMESVYTTTRVTDDHPASSAGNILQPITGLSFTIRVPPDSIAYVYASAEGVVTKENVDHTSFNKVAFDFFLIDDNNVSSYQDARQIVSVGPNIQVPATSSSQFDKTPWNIATTMTVEGDISPKGNPLPNFQTRNWTLQVHFGQYHNPGVPVGPSGAIVVGDNAISFSNTYESFSVMNVYVVFERSPNAPYPY